MREIPMHRFGHPVIGLGARLTMLALVFAAPAEPALAGDPQNRLAVFDFELLDTSLDGEFRGSNPAELARLDLISSQLRQWLAVNGGRELADMSPVAAEAKAANLRSCGCMEKLADRVGADLAVTGLVHKVSNLILNMTIYLHDVKTAKILALMTVDIRSNTDQSWTRGLNWLTKNRLTGTLAAVPAPSQP
ncbi:MAG: DUF3280 domain-containing protein [Pseudomonadota bacterium]|nr:DUF3280 domain-containing protein [Pseudomonadota bacterium]